MELAPKSFNPTLAGAVDALNPGTLLHRRLSSHNGLSVTATAPSAMLHIAPKSDAKRTFDVMDGAGLQPSIQESVATGDTKRHQNSMSPQPTKDTCVRCRENKLPCSGQNPCEGCSSRDLKCTWIAPKPKPKQRKIKSPPASKAESKGSLDKAGGSPVQVKSACTLCQKRKAKCSGDRPACTSCTGRHAVCIYTVAQGVSRTSDLKRKLAESDRKLQYFGRVFVAIRDGTEAQAMNVMVRMREREGLQSILSSLPDYMSSSDNGSEQAPMSRRFSTSIDICPGDAAVP